MNSLSARFIPITNFLTGFEAEFEYSLEDTEVFYINMAEDYQST